MIKISVPSSMLVLEYVPLLTEYEKEQEFITKCNLQPTK